MDALMLRGRRVVRWVAVETSTSEPVTLTVFESMQREAAQACTM
jgi:hypothetical protein